MTKSKDRTAPDLAGAEADDQHRANSALMSMHYETALANEKRALMAKELGYTDEMTIGALEDGIRFWQRRTVEACLELGKRLVLLKEITPHGEFGKRLEMLGIHVRAAQRFMSAALKTAKSDKLSHLAKQVKSQAAFLELITEDDDVLERLAAQDDVERMAPSELRKALRDARAEVQAKEDVLSKKNQAIDRLQEDVARIKRMKPDESAADLLKKFGGVVADAKGALAGSLRAGVTDVLKHYVTHGGADPSLIVAGAVAALQAELDALRSEFNLPDLAGAEVPAWLAEGEGAGTPQPGVQA